VTERVYRGPETGLEDEMQQSDRLYLVRHGETEWSRTRRHTSSTDLPLTSTGRQEAVEAARRISGVNFSLVLCSPMGRARETCEIAGLIDGAVLSEDLMEWNYGELEGLTRDEIRSRFPEWTVWKDGPIGGETAADVRSRVDRVIERAERTDGNVAAFGHGHCLRALAARWIGLEVADGARLSLGTGTVSELGFEREQRVILRWNA
jgi:broad specificity phosphatase PhoE